MSTILLIRHGQNDWVKKRRLAGWTPGVHLNEAGIAQVEGLVARLAELPLKAVYSSPLVRCLETAQPIAQAHGLEVMEHAGIGEVRYGQWEGKKLKRLAKRKAWATVQHYPSRFRFPDGEAFVEVQLRAVAALEELSRRHSQEWIAAVSHADIIKLLLAHYLGMHLDLFQRLVVAPASLNLIQFDKKGIARVLRFNDTGPITTNG